ncbi:MAG: Rieske 2Fe-2S domain-containing protein [Pirellulales bacterium]|nr:Rieske 2Fe-2S domain-containing protein [Pirellulales bacterium]
MGFFAKLFGICSTPLPTDPQCWSYENGKIEIDLSRASELTSPGAALRLEGKPLPQRVLVVRDKDGGFHAFPNRCTHAGHRRLDHIPEEGKVKCCSIGQSIFDYEGKRHSGSATDPIKPLRLEENDGKLTIWL